MALPPGIYMINGYCSDTILTGYEGPTGVKKTRTLGEIQGLGAKYMGNGKWDLGEEDQQIDSWSVAPDQNYNDDFDKLAIRRRQCRASLDFGV
ncbi:MAG: hypothetical protein ABF326_11185 [Arenicellales bacterium]